MSEIELKLLLLRYNMLSKKDDMFADMCIHDNGIEGHEYEWGRLHSRDDRDKKRAS